MFVVIPSLPNKIKEINNEKIATATTTNQKFKFYSQ